ncbi:MAG: trypsin-like peptidase domain-containing protein, partial [Hydrogenophaga sp.]|nr:trypsin-like peptidase domain-containing protein [Hydrogenophaga sp.]
MRKPALYSRSVSLGVVAAPKSDLLAAASPLTNRASLGHRLLQASASPRVMWGAMSLLGVLLLASVLLRGPGGASGLTQKDIDAAVLRTLTTQNLPSVAARAADKIRPSVVRVVSLAKNKKGEDEEQGVGTGVVIVDKGVILTNLHVVQSAQSIRLVFADGSTSAASVVGAQPENDLAVLQAHTIPDDLSAATLRSTHDLRPGEQVVAVGFPFGIGPSVSSGVISGLGRSFRSPEGEQEISNLIQFDAA